MLVQRLVRLFGLAAVLFMLGACSSSSDNTGTSGGTSGTPGAGPAFKGTLTGKGESGIVDVTLPVGAKIASVNPLAGEAPASTVIATITIGAKSFSLTGTWDDTTKTLTITGGGYTLTGKLSGSTLSGTYSGPNGAGSFALQAAVSGVVNVYCGTYAPVAGAAGGGGSWNLVQGADNKLSGSYTPSGAGGSGLLNGTLTGGAIALTVDSGAVANGTLSGDNITGTYGKPPAGTDGGTWTGSKGACGK